MPNIKETLSSNSQGQQYDFDPKNEHMDNKDAFEEGMKLFNAGSQFCPLTIKIVPCAPSVLGLEICPILPTTGELKPAILAFQADVQQNKDSSEV